MNGGRPVLDREVPVLRQVDQLREDIHKLEEELAQLAAGSAMMKPQVRQRIHEILERLPLLRGEVEKLARGGPSEAGS